MVHCVEHWFSECDCDESFDTEFQAQEHEDKCKNKDIEDD